MTEIELISWLADVWPEHAWGQATVYKGCFHHVAVATTAVARVSCHGHQPRRIAREHSTLTALNTLDLPFDHPRPLAPVIDHDGYSAMLTTVAPGSNRQHGEWDDLADGLGTLLHQLSTVDPTTAAMLLPAPRSWCGDQQWPEIVEKHVLTGIAPDLAAAARVVVDDLLAAEQGVQPAFVHGDFGPHNVLWIGDKPSAVIDFDHCCIGDPAIDIASLISFYGADNIAARTGDDDLLDRALRHRASFPLQLAAAAVLVDDQRLFHHAVGNFTSRLRSGALHDPHGRRPETAVYDTIE